MNKLIKRGLLALTVLLGMSVSMKAQQLPPLPADTALIKGQLENGLTYYIRHNDNPKGQADFFIAQRVGSILEEDNQRGLAHFLEHMCFNGTTNFPGKNIINWLESIGVKFGHNLNAYTSIDETVYNISSVPVSRTSVQDSCLLILHDWSCDLTLDPVEIDAERAVIHEEWRQSNVGSMRIMEKLLPVMYPDNRYGYRLPIGTMEVVDNFPPQALIDYYHKWYRPDNQAIIVVGDIDPAYIEAKIKEIFTPITMPENPAERVYFEVDETPGTIYALGSDKEMQFAVVELFFKTNGFNLPREMRNSEMYYVVDYISSMIQSMMNSRFSELSNKPDTKFAQATLEIGDYMVSKTMGALELQVLPKGDDLIPAFKEAYTELMRAVKGGFTIGEYERARAEFLSNIEKQYDNRFDRKSGSYSLEYVREFIDNFPAPGIGVEKEIYDRYAALITVEQINQSLAQCITEDNRVLLTMLPESYTMPTEEQFATVMEEVDDAELEPYKDEMRPDPLIPALPAAGKVVAVKDLADWGAKEYTLSNGVKVVVKSTDFKNNEIIFNAIAKGKGSSTLDDSFAPSVLFAPYAMSSMSLNDYSNSDVQKYLQGKQAAVSFSFSDYTRELNGNSTVKDLPTLMEMLYSYFTGFGLREDEYTATRDAIASILANQENTPNFVFSRDILKTIYAAPSMQMLTSSHINAANREAIVNMVRDMMANAADYTFFFAGNIDEATFVPMMEQYIATLPADAATATTTYEHNPAYEIGGGNTSDHYTTKMETPQTYVFIAVLGQFPYTQKNKIIASVAGQVLSKRLLDKVREEMGAVYSIGASCDMGRTDVLNTVIQTAFPMKPELKDETLAVIRSIMEAMTTDVTTDEIKPAIEFLVKDNKEKLKENRDWVGAMSATTLNGVNIFLNREEVINTVTVEDVQNFMRDLLAQDNYRVVVLDPEGVTEEASK
ncbi:MAG: insulinase family protein [Muribaculaceae bacterium]|nr:insulinase family protein [Muribaculaceae bacterium]